MMILSILFGILNGRMGEVSQAVMEGGSNAVQLMLVLLGAMCLWSGLMRIAEKGGLTAIISKILSPITKWIFRGMDPKSPAGKAISMNMTANLLGLGNAATPLGLHAMKEMQRHNPEKQLGDQLDCSFAATQYRLHPAHPNNHRRHTGQIWSTVAYGHSAGGLGDESHRTGGRKSIRGKAVAAEESRGVSQERVRQLHGQIAKLLFTHLSNT